MDTTSNLHLDEKLLHTIALSLNDFPEFNSIIALKWLLNVSCLLADQSIRLSFNRI